MLMEIIKEDFKEIYLSWNCCIIDHGHNSIDISKHQFNKTTIKWTNGERNLRRADRIVLKDFPRNYTLILCDLTDPSWYKIKNAELTRKNIFRKISSWNPKLIENFLWYGTIFSDFLSKKCIYALHKKRFSHN